MGKRYGKRPSDFLGEDLTDYDKWRIDTEAIKVGITEEKREMDLMKINQKYSRKSNG